MVRVTSYFEIDARAELAYDTETDEPSETYLQVSTEHSRELTPQEIEKVHQSHARMVTDQLEIAEEYLRPISQEEYERNMDGDY